MRKDDEISSTEKLLNIIRSGKEKSIDQPGQTTEAISEIPQASAIDKVFSFQKKVTAGLVFGSRSITLLMLSQMSDLKWQLVNYACIENEPGVRRDSSAFSDFLKKTMVHFLGGARTDVDIWAAVSSERVEMRHLVIPKVPDDQVANAVLWSYKKLVPINENDVIFDFTILDEIVEDKKPKLRIAAYAAPRRDIEALKALLSDIGFSPVGISIIPFALQNLFRTGFVKTDTDHVCALFVGRDWSRIDVFTHGDLVLSRGIKTGINSIVEAIRLKLNEAGHGGAQSDTLEDPAGGPGTPLKMERSEHSEEAQAIVHRLIKNDALLSDDQKSAYQITEDDVIDAIMPVLERLVRQVERTIGHFALNFGNEGIGDIFLSGKITGNTRLAEMIGSLMPYAIKSVDPFFSTMLTNEKIELPASVLERDLFVPAMGLAISDNSRTPNFLFTFKSKQMLAKISRINKAIFSFFLVIIIVCSGLFYWQGIQIDRKREAIGVLKQKIGQYSPNVDLELIQKIAAKTVSKRQQKERVAERYLGLAAMKELSGLVPKHIRLLSVKADFGRLNSGGKDVRKTFLVDGIVSGPPSERETTLAVYMFKLNESSIFGDQELMAKKVVFFGNKEVLRFSTRMELM